jgi:DNA-binding Lrp family transcriptional regulator
VTKAYVLVVAESAAMKQVAAALRAVDGVTDVQEVMGPYDIVAQLETDSVVGLMPALLDTVRNVGGIQSTTTLVAFKQP